VGKLSGWSLQISIVLARFRFGEMPSEGRMEMPSLGASYRVSAAFAVGLLVLEPRGDQSSASSNRSSPQKISLPITNVGEPNIPSERAVSVSASYVARTADPFARSRTAPPSQTNLGMLLSHRKHTSPPRLLARRHGWGTPPYLHAYLRYDPIDPHDC